ncbi:hypothetical protein H9K75_17920 [Diaphorobacter aerolatus]|uniref:Uncharacterized protein n=1 Tax=Diaphorobacter aerolatus TaxID=1288495 RepID=A0A7H0GI49_9BURK|nr:hypothetical protein H9K75_17920 [Diaphorobacter aerolatus]
MPSQRRETKGIAEYRLRPMSQWAFKDWLIGRGEGGAWMKAKGIARCFTVKKTALGTIRMNACGAGNTTAKGRNLWCSDMIQAVNIHILVVALSVGHHASQFRPETNSDSVFSVSMC